MLCSVHQRVCVVTQRYIVQKQNFDSCKITRRRRPGLLLVFCGNCVCLLWFLMCCRIFLEHCMCYLFDASVERDVTLFESHHRIWCQKMNTMVDSWCQMFDTFSWVKFWYTTASKISGQMDRQNCCGMWCVGMLNSFCLTGISCTLDTNRQASVALYTAWHRTNCQRNHRLHNTRSAGMWTHAQQWRQQPDELTWMAM